MERNLLQFDQSGWWILVILILALAITWILYSISKTPWTKSQNLILASIRFLGVFLVLSLLLEPLINHIISRSELPIITLAVDNSSSVIARTTDSTSLESNIDNLRNELEDGGFEVKIFALNEENTITFDHPTSDLSSLHRKIESSMEGRNWVGNVLLSDGIFNEGTSPVYMPSLVPQFTVGLGDTIAPKDINISRVQFNKVSFKGNETPIRVEISQKGFDNQSLRIQLKEGEEVLQEKLLQANQAIQEVDFTVLSRDDGLRKLSLEIPIQKDEFVKENNRREIIMEIIDGKTKLLIVSEAPHPDIKAIKSALSDTENYQVDSYITSIDQSVPTELYDVVIYHGAFSKGMKSFEKENPGIWNILNDRSSINQMNKALPFLSIQRQGFQPDNVTPSLNLSFSKFKLPENKRVLEDFPPIEVVFGDYKTSGPTEVLLYQQVGSVKTKKPLFIIFDDGSNKQALLAGSNIWKWRLQEYAVTGGTKQFDDIISKTVQFLSVKNDRKQFQFRPNANRFSNLEPIFMLSEAYNDIYERIYGNKISVKVTSEDGSVADYEFVDSKLNSSFKIPPMKEGIYTFEASTQVGEKTFRDSGRFVVEEINKEYLNLTADHDLLKTVAAKTGGEYLHYNQLGLLGDQLKSRGFRPLIRSTENFTPLIQNPLMLLIILLLFSTEWVLRKYWGGY